jgi:hypothetical protein
MSDIGELAKSLADYGLSGPEEVLILGSDIFVTNFTSGTVGEYTTGGGTVNAALISGLTDADAIATDGTNLYVTNGLDRGSVSEYTTSGVLVNAALISGLGTPDGIAVVTSAAPEPGGLGLLAVALAGLGIWRRKLAAARTWSELIPRPKGTTGWKNVGRAGLWPSWPAAELVFCLGLKSGNPPA